uniref:CWH43-like N-terminal domain-containing protein n=1 Tax=Denticeps clupeoides TaxID=299321 RepID=A0AAY4ANY9_9TELE
MWALVLLPLFLALGGAVGLWAVFAIAVSNNSVNLTEEFPYISTCGSYTPQSCAFSQICNICCFLAMWIVVIRYQQILDLGGGRHANTASLVLGFISSIGISVLGNFQQSVAKSVHLLGAFLAFFFGLAYFWVQVWLTYRAEPSQDRRWLGPLRVIFCSICSGFVLAMAILYNTGNRSASAVCEWVLVMSFFALFSTFAAEFRLIDCHRLTVQNRGTAQTQNNAVHSRASDKIV